MSNRPLLTIPLLQSDLAVTQLLAAAPPALGQLAACWDGRPAPATLRTDFWLGWTTTALYAVFTCSFERLQVAATPQYETKTMQLWDRDVVELFLAPDPSQPERYREVEVSPLGEWVDVALQFEAGSRHSDWTWHSGVTAACAIMPAERQWRAAFRLPALQLVDQPFSAGQEYQGNLYRCAGAEPDRQYLAWAPTLTPTPNFHVPQSFGRLRLGAEAIQLEA